MNIIELSTKRLKLRQWKKSDFQPFAVLNSDKEVMEFFPKTLSSKTSLEIALKLQDFINRNGWGFWAVEKLEDKKFIGFVGLNKPDYQLPFSPCVEIGWRLAKENWNKGYATEAAQEALRFGFKKLELTEIVAFTPVQNIKSETIMKKINMINTNQNFMHPKVPENHILSEHLLYKITKQQWDNINQNNL